MAAAAKSLFMVVPQSKVVWLPVNGLLQEQLASGERQDAGILHQNSTACRGYGRFRRQTARVSGGLS